MAKKRYTSSFLLASILYGGVIAVFAFLYDQKIELNLIPEKKNEELIKFEIVEYTPPPSVVKQEPKVEPKPKPEPKPQKELTKKSTPQPKPKPEPKKTLEKPTQKKVVPQKIVKKEKPTPTPKPKPEPEPEPEQKPEPKQEIVKKVEPKKTTPQPKPQKIAEKKPTPIIDHKALEVKKENYFNQVKHLIDQNKVYPKIAIRRGIEGLVKIQFTLSNDGKLLSYNITDGPRIFKKSIEQAIQSSFPFHPPKDLFTSNIDLSLTLHYKLY